MNSSLHGNNWSCSPIRWHAFDQSLVAMDALLSIQKMYESVYDSFIDDCCVTFVFTCRSAPESSGRNGANDPLKPNQR